MKERTYIAIDLKSFYASVECRERGLDPMDTNLVVADESRTDKTICLAVTPSLKSYGISGRGRLFEVKQRVKEANAGRRHDAPGRKLEGSSHFFSELQANPELAIDFIIAPPRMAYYMEYSTRIYEVYMKYIAPEDIVVYSIDEVDFHAYRSNKQTYRQMRQLSDEICKEHGLSVIPPSQSKGMSYKEYTEAKSGTSWKQKLKQTIDRCVITAKDYDEFLKMMQDAGYEIKTGKYISFRAEGQERFTRAKTIGENYTEERIKERIQGRNPRKRQMQSGRKGISLIGDIQERIKLIDSKGYEHKAKLTILKEAARTLNYLTENNLLQYADLEKKVEDIHSSYARTGKELKSVEARLREIQPLIKNISNYQKLKPVYDAYMKAKDKPAFKAKHEAELVIFEAAKSTLLAMQGDKKLPSLKSLQAEQQRLLEDQQRLYDERAKLKKEARVIDTMKANVDDFLSPIAVQDRDKKRNSELV